MPSIFMTFDQFSSIRMVQVIYEGKKLVDKISYILSCNNDFTSPCASGALMGTSILKHTPITGPETTNTGYTTTACTKQNNKITKQHICKTQI